MKVVVDSLSIGVGKSGAVGVYRNLLHYSPEFDPAIQWFVYVSPTQQEYYEKFINPAYADLITFRRCNCDNGNRLKRLWLQHVIIPSECSSRQADVHFTLNPEPFFSIRNVKEVYKITGLQFYHVPDQLGRVETLYQRALVRRKASRADLIIANSEYMRQDILALLPVTEDRVCVVYEAVDHSIFHQEADLSPHFQKLIDQYHVDWPYILDVSDLRPYKNPTTLLNAYARLVADRHIPHHLVFIGHDLFGYRAKLDRAIGETGLIDRVHVFEYIHHWDLVSFYYGASVLVYPSELETFGTPPLEAMACGVPAIISNASAMPEISGGGAVMVNPRDVEQLAEEIYRLISSPDYRDEWIQKGLAWCQRYSWARNVKETLMLLKDLVEK